ncbi:unnamed protein product [Caenorhabditis brenneri]
MGALVSLWNQFVAYYNPEAYVPDFERKNRNLSVHWKVEKDDLKIIKNKNANNDTSRDLEFLSEKEQAIALTNRRRVFGAYAIIQNFRAEFTQYIQTGHIFMNDQKIDHFKKLRKLSNVNIVQFYGVQLNDRSLDTLTFFHSLQERGTLEAGLNTGLIIYRNSLQEFCVDEKFDFNETFKSAFMRDILKGLAFIHRNVGYHGHLHAATCLIDINWVLKLSQFGISNFICDQFDSGNIKVNDKDPPVFTHQQYVCYPPEHIRQYDTTGTKQPRILRGTRQGDMYCVGMVFYMMVEKHDPFLMQKTMERISPALIDDILNKNRQPVCEKKTGERELENGLLEKCQQCWSRDPDLRPTTSDMERTVAATYPFAKGTLVDQMVRKNEKAAEDLEYEVEEKTAHLVEARDRTMTLLKEMLPPDIAISLRDGKSVPARSYDSATVMFVQICDFTKIMKFSSPNEVIKFLNDVFDSFDEVTRAHDAYKVETTGETYMVASGVPKENGGIHVTEIAEMSLKIREVSYRFILCHKPDFKLSIRIGFHAGPIAAGVIGIRSPRYCLFGDTVNFASRMQSNCPPNQIQTSERTANMLDKNEYKLVKRGIVHVKGKGEVNCYWLNEHVHHDKSEEVETPILDLHRNDQPGPSYS